MALEREMEAMGYPITIHSLFRGCSCVVLSLPSPDNASEDDRLFWKLSETAVSSDVPLPPPLPTHIPHPIPFSFYLLKVSSSIGVSTSLG